MPLLLRVAIRPSLDGELIVCEQVHCGEEVVILGSVLQPFLHKTIEEGDFELHVESPSHLFRIPGS